MSEFIEYVIENHKDFMKLPCGYYETVDIIKTDGTILKRVRAGDSRFASGKVKQWRLSEIQGVPKHEVCCGGYYHDSTTPSSAQEFGLEDKDFEFY